MKRSDAIKTVGKVLAFGVEGFSKSDQEKYKDMSLADIILTELEEAGMLPPRGELDASQMFILNTNMKVPHLWEPEDERSTEES